LLSDEVGWVKSVPPEIKLVSAVAKASMPRTPCPARRFWRVGVLALLDRGFLGRARRFGKLIDQRVVSMPDPMPRLVAIEETIFHPLRSIPLTAGEARRF
jgi:hypothetical protein